MVAKFCVYRQKESFVNPEQKRYLSTARRNWQRIKTIYRRLTHKQIDYNIALEASALITEESIRKAKPKPVARYRDLVTFITDGVFGNHLLLRCPCEQLQLAAHHLIVSYCAVRPSEVTLAWLATDALKYCDLEFYLTLWDNNDDDEQDDDDNELMEDDGGMLVVRDSGHEVQPSQRRRTRYRLGCEVTFRNLKGGRTDPNMYRTQPLIFAGELLKKAEYLITMGLHPSEIIQGYEIARDRCLAELEELSVATLSTPPTMESLALALKPCLASKQYGNEELLAPLVAEAVSMVLPQNAKNGLADFSVDNVRVVKIMGGSLSQSKVVRGMVFGREPEGVVKKAKAAKVGVYTCGMDITQTETKGTVLLKNADELSNFSRGEEQQLEKYFKEIADYGVKVVVTQSQVGELAQHYLNRFGILVIKILSKFELRRLCRLLGATPLARLGAPLPEEAGWIDSIETTEIGGDRVTVFTQEQGQPGGKTKPKMCTIFLRGATGNLLDDVERAIDDGVNVIKSLTRDARLVPGAGATETELAKRIADLGEKTSGLNQHSIKKFAEALEVVPRTLAENAGFDSTEIVSRLYAKHVDVKAVDVGVDIENQVDGTMSMIQRQVLDVLVAKSWALRYATGAAISVLRVNSIIISKPAGIKAPKTNPNWDDD